MLYILPPALAALDRCLFSELTPTSLQEPRQRHITILSGEFAYSFLVFLLHVLLLKLDLCLLDLCLQHYEENNSDKDKMLVVGWWQWRLTQCRLGRCL